MSGVAYTTPACGLNKAFRSLCGNNQATSAPSSPSHIAGGSTPVTLGAGGNYILDGNLNCGVGTDCITSNNSNTVIYLNGFTVTGRVQCQFNCGGFEIYGGTLNCTLLDGAKLGCLSIADGNNGNVTVKVHDMTGANSVDTSGGASRWFNLDWGGTPSGPITVTLDHLDISMTNVTDASTTRVCNLNCNGATNGQVVVNLTNSKLTCGTGTAACQGIQYYAAQGKCHNNYGNMQQNVSAGDSSRFVAFDGGTTGGIEAYNNDIDANNNRAIRARNVTGLTVHDNWIWNLNAPGGINTTAGFHFGDPDTNDNMAMGINIFNNKIELAATAVGVMARDETGVTFTDNLISCNGSCAGGAGTFLYLRDPAGNGPPSGTNSAVTLRNNRGIAGIGFTNEITVQNGAALSYCNSGTAVTSGTGTATTITCP